MKNNISIIAAVAMNNVIGRDNQLAWQLAADLAYFKRMTLGKPIIMGRKTYQSIGRALPGRRNIVLSRDPDFCAANIEVYASLDAALQACATENEIMIIGGSGVYAQALSAANKLYITIVHASPEGDAYFPEWRGENWQQVSAKKFQADTANEYDYEFTVWEKS